MSAGPMADILPRWRPVDGLREEPRAEGRGAVPMNATDRVWYARFTVFLGSDANFDLWGDPITGHTCYVGNPAIGCLTGGYGDRYYWRSLTYHHASTGTIRTEAGQNW